MAKGKQKKASKRNNGLGCLALIVFGVAIYVVSQMPANRSSSSLSPRNQIAATQRPTRTVPSTATDTRTERLARLTATPGFTPEAGLAMTMEPEIYTTTGDGNLRSCASRDCDVVDAMIEGTAIRVTGVINGESVQTGNAVWYVVEHEGETAYLYSNLARRGEPAPTIAPAQIQNQIQPTSAPVVQPPANNQRRPANCADAISMGLTAEQAGQWPHLDRDDDGVACYGD